jgi:DNA repair exonuclease SbcCD ATPase subunit
MKFKILIVLFVAFFSSTTFAQEGSEPTDNALSTQFREMKDNANNYQEYKVVKETNLNTFWKNVQDTLAERRQQYIESQNRIQAQQQEISRLTSDVSTRDTQIEEAEGKIANLSVLGMEFNKESFVLFFWIVLAILLVVIAIILYKHRYSRQFAKRKHNDYEALEAEFNDFKTRAREKETRLMRDLQTERNRYEELNQRGGSRSK